MKWILKSRPCWISARAGVGVALVASALSGCAGDQPVKFSERPSVESLTPPTVDMPPASSGVQHFRDYNSSLAAKQAETKENESSSLDKASAAMARAGHSIKDSLTFQPKIVRAKDPLAMEEGTQALNPQVFFSLAGVYESQGKLELAVQQFKKGLDADPSNVKGWIKFARMYDRQGDFRQATMAYQRALTLEPQNPTALNDLGLCLARRGDFGNAVESLQKAVATNPGKKLYRNNLATVLVATGRYDEAMSQLQAAHAPGAAHYNLAVLLLKEKRNDLAVQHLREAVRRDPNLTRGRELLANLERRSGDPRGQVTAPARPNATAYTPRQAPPHYVPQNRGTQPYAPRTHAPQPQPAPRQSWAPANGTPRAATRPRTPTGPPSAYYPAAGAGQPTLANPRMLPPTTR